MKQRKNFIRLLAMMLSAALLLPVLTGCKRRERVTKETEEITLGIDVAKYQGTIDWQQVAGAGIDFAIVRVGYRGMENGEINADTNGRYNLQEASKAGIPVGAYFFSTAVSKEEAVEEAEWLAGQIAPYPITYPVVYDCEGFNNPDSRQSHMNRKERTNVALAFLETIESFGYEGMFYASKGDMEYENAWEVSRIEDDYKIWVAQYPQEPYPETPQSSYSGTHHMWQYATDGLIPGITQPVDLNVAYFGYDGIEEPKDKKTAQIAEADVEALMDFEEISEMVTAKAETNLRNIPSQGEDSEVLRTLKNGELAHRIAISSSGWSKITIDNELYYAVSSYLTTDLNYQSKADIVVPAEADDDIETQFYAASQLVTAKDTVNLRNIPSVERADAQIIAQLKHGDVATCIGTSDNGWSKLIYRGTTCYAISSYLTDAGGSPAEEEIIGVDFKTVNEQVTAKDKVNLRTLPSVENKDSEILVQLERGDVAARIGISDNGWSKLVYNGVTCYAVSRYLSVMSSTPVQSQPEQQKKEAQIETQFEEMNDKVTAKVEVNLRSLPSVEDPNCVVVAKLKNGEVAIRTGINHDVGWSRVVYNGQTLYCVSSYLKAAE